MTTLDSAQTAASDDALRQLTSDPRYEWLDPKAADEALWRLACEARVKPHDSTLVDVFVDQYAREPRRQTCFFPVVGLGTDIAVDLFGIKLLPPAEAPPPPSLAPWTNLMETHSAVAATEVRGTRASSMAARGQEVVEHALRLLRMTLRVHREIADQQLRFRLGPVWWLDDGSHHWRMADRGPAPLRLPSDLIEMVAGQPVTGLPASAGDQDRRARSHRPGLV